MTPQQIIGAALIACVFLAVGSLTKSAMSWGEWLTGWLFALGVVAAVAVGASLLAGEM